MKRTVLMLLLAMAGMQVYAGAGDDGRISPLFDAESGELSIVRVAQALSSDDGGREVFKQNIQRAESVIENAKAKIADLMLPEDSERAVEMRQWEAKLLALKIIWGCGPLAKDRIIEAGLKADAKNSDLNEIMMTAEFCYRPDWN